MTLLDPERTEQENRALRMARVLMLLLLGVIVAACLFFSYIFLIPETKRYLLGSVADYPLDQPTERAVPKLAISDFIELRPRVSQDVLFVTRMSDGSWQALLGVDTRTGCFLTWDGAASSYRDPCSGRSYDRRGRDRSGELNGPFMVRVPVLIEQEQVLVEDRMCQEGKSCP